MEKVGKAFSCCGTTAASIGKKRLTSEAGKSGCTLNTSSICARIHKYFNTFPLQKKLVTNLVTVLKYKYDVNGCNKVSQNCVVVLPLQLRIPLQFWCSVLVLG